MISRREWLSRTTAAVAGVALGARPLLAAPAKTMTVYKTPTCGCCKLWVDHVRNAGWTITAKDLDQEALDLMKNSLGVPSKLWSCHVGTANGYAFEGHVPVDLIDRVIAEKPKIAGLAVPGMPVGSPGMEVPGRNPDKFDVIAWEKGGKTKVFATRNG
jgi:hypothetical protein